MQPRSRIVAAVAFLGAGAVLAVAGFFSGAPGLDPAQGAAVGFLGLVIAALGALLLRRGLAGRAGSVSAAASDPLPLPYYTRNCPFCGRRLGLKAEKCPDCRRRLPDDATCSAGATDAASAVAAFAAARETALAAGSTGYVWRATHDGAACERCANNDGHVCLWEQEPIGGHAGARPRCRCRPEPVFPATPPARETPSPARQA